MVARLLRSRSSPENLKALRLITATTLFAVDFDTLMLFNRAYSPK
jgi:hypothetical protein